MNMNVAFSNDVRGRYATVEEATSLRYAEVVRRTNAIATRYSLHNHADDNRQRYPWSVGLLEAPEIYASRMWEYPFAYYAFTPTSGMTVADLGCGRTPFTPLLVETGATVIGFDSEIIAEEPGEQGSVFGVSHAFAQSVGFELRQSLLDQIDAPDATFDRAYCLSVIEHIPTAAARANGMREIARILKPGGYAIITLDVNLMMRIADPLRLIWESGLQVVGGLDLTMPHARYGRFYTLDQPTDVFGFVLQKLDAPICTAFGEDVPEAAAWETGRLRDTLPPMCAPEPVVRECDRKWYAHLSEGFGDHPPTLRRVLRILWTYGIRPYLKP